MIPLIPVIGILAAVGIGSVAASFILGEMTEVEKRKQSQLREDMDLYSQNRQKQIQKLAKQYQMSEEEFMHSNNAQIKALRQRLFDDQLNQKMSIVSRFIQVSEEQLKQIEMVISDIQTGIGRLKSLLTGQKTYLRQEAMYQLRHELEEALNKAKGYKQYLKDYKKFLTKKGKFIDPTDYPMSFKMPDDYPYLGKIMLLEKEQIQTGRFQIKVIHGFELSYELTDWEAIDEVADEAVIPILISEFSRDTYTYMLSASKGFLKHIALNQTKIGIEATVNQHLEDRSMMLEFKALKLKLRRKNLENPRKLPLVGAKLRVYPIKWDAALRYNVEVSEKYEDSIKSFHFSNLPIVFRNEDCDTFVEYVENNRISDEHDEWKIGPLNEDGKHCKLQLGDQMIFTVRYQFDAQKQLSYFLFEDFLPLEENFKPDDIFVVMNATCEMVSEYEMHLLSDEAYMNMNNLSILLFKEFRIQNELAASQEGMRFFTKWTEVIEKLIHFLSKGDSITAQLEINQIQRLRGTQELDEYIVRILNNEEVQHRLEKILSTGMAEFIVELENGKYVVVEFTEDLSALKVFVEKGYELTKQQVTIYKKHFCYPEIQQLNALNVFRSGLLVKPQLQSYTLNSANVHANRLEKREFTYFNEQLMKNPAQKYAVEQALLEQDFYLIQGPPGTGKTTVIREILKQKLKETPSTRILIVSQANVAIDNVLKGLDNQFTEQIIRCGNSTKIDAELMQFSFDVKYNNYVSDIQNKQLTPFNEDLLTRWKSFVGTEKENANPLLGELLVKNHQIIGATCVGLMDRKIGLDQVEFDLVIIDEAGKALPAELIIPINKANKVILIGDHKQLPPVINPALYDEEKIELTEQQYCRNELFTTSLFKRLYENCPDSNKMMLTTQYRMPAIIGTMISKFFYDEKLENGVTTIHRPSIYFKSNLNFLDMSLVSQYHETKVNKSVLNEYEAELVARIVTQIRESIPMNKKIAVICPYKGQNGLIRRTLKNYIDIYQNNIAINTIDAYQGDEAEIVIYCMTRSKQKTNYFSDKARLNVAFSRVKNDLLIIGSIDYLKSYGENHILNQIVDYIEQHGMILTEMQPLRQPSMMN